MLTETANVSSQHAEPSAYPGASYEVLKKGTKVNSTHWQYTAKCSGCTSFIASNDARVVLATDGDIGLAFAASFKKPKNPASNTSAIEIHDAYGYWGQTLGTGANANFTSLLAKART